MPYTDPQSSEAKEARRLANQRYYERTKGTQNDKRRQTKIAFKAWMTSLKEGQPCVDCGHSYHPVAMDWHHIDAATKTIGVANLVAWGNRQKVLDEIAKCELVCANCHRVRTWFDSQTGDTIPG